MKMKSHIMLPLLFILVALNAALYIFFKPNKIISEKELQNQTSENNIATEMSNKTVKEKNRDSIKSADPMEIHFDAIVVDTHNDFVWKVFDKGAVFGRRNGFTHSDLPKLKEGGVDVQVFAVWIPMNQVKRSYDFTNEQINRLKKFEADNFSDFEYAENHEDIIRITGEKKICGLIGIEGGTAIENDLDNLQRFYDLGVRYIGLTWNNSNKISTSAKDAVLKNKKGGLTEFGLEVIKKMNETGMLIDVSHLSEAGFWDVIENSEDPVIASHSNCYAINPHYRNLTDEQIKAIADKGGYIGINFYDEFLDENGKANGVSIDKVIEHIDHIKKIAGTDCIGIGSDFDGGITPPRELYDATQYPELTKKLFERGYSESEVRKILGENFLRVFKRVCG